MNTDLWVIIAYLGAMLVIGACVASGARDVEGYTVGNRRVPGWATGLSVLGTFLSSITFLALPATIYRERSWNAYVFSLALPVAGVIAVRWFVPLYRGGVNLSAYELLEQRFGYWARGYSALSFVVLQVLRVSMVILLVALAVEPMLHWGIPNTIIGLTLIVIVYDVVGGIRAVIWTDVLQVFVLLGAALWCVSRLVLGHPGGAGQFFADVPSGAFSLGEFAGWDLAQSTFLVVFIYGLSENLRNYSSDQNYVQRVLCTATDREARQSIWLAALSYPVVSLLFCLLGTGLAVFYDEPTGQASAASASVESGVDHMPLPPDTPPDKVFPHFIQHELPPLARGLLLAGILAAAMSTIDSSLNSSSMVVLVDLLRRWRRRKSRLPEIVTLRLTTISLGIAGAVGAVVIYELNKEKSEALMRAWWTYAGVVGAGMFGLFLLAWLLPRLRPRAALLALLAGVPVVYAGISGRIAIHGNLVGVIGVAAIFAAGWALCLIAPAANRGSAE